MKISSTSLELLLLISWLTDDRNSDGVQEDGIQKPTLGSLNVFSSPSLGLGEDVMIDLLLLLFNQISAEKAPLHV